MQARVGGAHGRELTARARTAHTRALVRPEVSPRERSRAAVKRALAATGRAQGRETAVGPGRPGRVAGPETRGGRGGAEAGGRGESLAVLRVGGGHERGVILAGKRHGVGFCVVHVDVVVVDVVQGRVFVHQRDGVCASAFSVHYCSFSSFFFPRERLSAFEKLINQ